ncbi:MAG: hypothetical protein D6689_00375 [Deltaproteobacteria bacterium]|nr:MAG: hypothetical protein D6689_00375 [Deltaproteobacteria bacterium]
MRVHPSLSCRGRGPRRLAFALAAAVAAAACGDDTGLLIEVSRDAATTPPAIDRLEFFIGRAGPTGTYIQDAQRLPPIDLAAGRDLAVDPYALLLRPADAMRGTDAEVMVAVIGTSRGERVGFGRLDGPVSFADGKVLRWQVVLRGGGDYDVSDTGCLVYDEAVIAPPDDMDCDGDRAPADCDDSNPDVGPSAPERCDNDVDDNCNGQVDEEVDGDGDGVTNCDDCDDTNPDVHPGADEVCDGLDNDCRDGCDAEFDADEDGFTVCGSKIEDGGASCEPPKLERVDCDDRDGDVHPGADDDCDGVDNDCNGVCDDGWDPDMDNYTECGSRVDVCDGTDDASRDCMPEDGDVYPGAPERCNGIDDNCDGEPYAESSPCYASATTEEGEAVCVVGVRACDDAPGGAGWGECAIEGRVDDPAFHVPIELCAAYDACDAADVPDPFDCANEMGADRTVACTVAVADAGEPALCPKTYAPVPRGDSPGGCEWQIVGGARQPHWQVGLSPLVGDAPPAGPTVVATDACAVWFHVIDAVDAPPQAGAVMLHHVSAQAGDVLIRVLLHPEVVADCPDPGLTCDAPLLPGP